MSSVSAKRGRGGYRYVVTDEQIRWWSRLPAWRKLQWLEEANQFLDKFMTRRARRVRELLRQG